MRPYALTIAVLWIVVLAYWIIAASKARRNMSVGQGGLGWLALRAAFAVAIALAIRLHGFTRLGRPLLLYGRGAHLAAALGVVLCAAGVALALWARATLGRNWGMPMTVKEDPELIASGPYARIRHPIYTGFILAAMGSALVLGILWLIALAFFSPYFIYSAVKEEKLMLKQFPTQYPDYMRRTKRFVPFLF